MNYAYDPELAFYIHNALSYAMDGNDMEEYLTYLIGKKSVYATVFKKVGLTLDLCIKDIKIDDDWTERDIVGLGLSRDGKDKDGNQIGINPKTGEYQYVTYVDDTEPEDMKGIIQHE